MGTSADGYFAAVAAWFVALVALAATARTIRRSCTAAFGAGLVFGLICYLSYGLTLFAVIGAGVLVLGRRRLRALPFLIAGTAVVPLAFTLVGFDWWEAYHPLVERYYQGAGGFRPYGYWVWANLACTVLVVGPATVAGLRRIAALVVRERARLLPIRARTRSLSVAVETTPRHTSEVRLALLVLLALGALLVAGLSGMSKAETERIWLPFAVWLLAAGALLPRPRAWLAAQAALALLLNHLLLTGW